MQRFAGWPPERQGALCTRLLWRAPLIRAALVAARELALPQWRIASGALYNTIWNQLTRRPLDHGVRDIDIIYFDAADLSYAAEDRQIRRAAAVFAGFAPAVELRNQARVHLWFERRFGQPYPPLRNADQSLERYASRSHAIGLRLEHDGRLDLVAPFGLSDILALRVTPYPALDNRAAYRRKADRALSMWPELSVEPWIEIY